MLLVSCGTAQAPSEEAPPQPARESVAEPSEAPENTVDEVTEEAVTEAPEALPPIEGPRNFVTPHHCHPPGPCTFEFETVRGVQHIDVGHGHASAPRIDVVLRVGEGSARLEGIQATSANEMRGTVVARSRDSLEGGAFYVTLDGSASATEVELSFPLE